MTMKHTWAQMGGVVLAACLCMAVGAPARAGDAPAGESATRQVAQVAVEIKQETGQVAKNTAQLEWNEESAVVFEGAEHKHDVSVKLVRREGNSKKVSVTVAYKRDGQAVIAPHTFDTTVKKREVIRIEGGLAIALTVTPKTIKLEPPKKKEPDVDLGDGNDPLSGL
jgi:hypothetical protein